MTWRARAPHEQAAQVAMTHRETQLPKWINSILSPREPTGPEGQEQRGAMQKTQ